MADEPLIDRSHLEAQTCGDRDLADELLGLFEAQCRSLMPGIADAAKPAAERADLAHTLKGSALGVGTFRVAARAAEAEDAFRGGGATPEAIVEALAHAVEETLAHLAVQG